VWYHKPKREIDEVRFWITAEMNAESASEELTLLLDKVYRNGGYDFREYRPGTVSRRLERRLQATGTRTYQEYGNYLDDHPEEYQELAEYLTIRVSGFFRSTWAFQQIERLVLPELVAKKRSQKDRNLKFWSAACARGEEPYSLAILLSESFKNRYPDFDAIIYATDISKQSLRDARQGVYPSKDVGSLPSRILEAYFVRRDGHYEVSADIKRMVRFSFFDLTSTTPPDFVKVDLISCCNVLIYWQRALQDRALNMLFHSLRPRGYLVLGEVETPAYAFRERLQCIDGKARIYQKIAID